MLRVSAFFCRNIITTTPTTATRLLPESTSAKRLTTIRSISSSSSSALLDDESITIGDITVPTSPRGSNRPDLVPILNNNDDFHHNNTFTNLNNLPPCHFSHLRWMLQKDLVLKQDFLLLGTPNLSRERRELIFLYASLLGREVEYVSLSKDTSEADLKQRKEVVSADHGGTIYVNQAPVRAAIHGRLLILDGLEKAERNVLPTLNNLLENRELPLDDGTMLINSDHYHDDVHHEMGISVHPDFRVAALGSLSMGESAALDPPLRSRFQARLANAVKVGDLFQNVAASCSTISSSTGDGSLSDMAHLKSMVQSVEKLSNGAALQSVRNAARYYFARHEHVTPRAVLNAYGLNSTGDMMTVNDIIITSPPLNVEHCFEDANNNNGAGSTHGVELFVETKTTKGIRDLICAALDLDRAVCVVGPKGCYKSAVARYAARSSSEAVGNLELFSLHADMASRDLLMLRSTTESGDTVWKDTPLTRAARRGSWVILDGIDKLRSDTLSSLALLIEQGWAALPDGTRFHANENFRCIGIAHPPTDKSWITPEVKAMFHWIEAKPLPSDELRDVLTKLYPSLDTHVLDKILHLQKVLDDIHVDSLAEQESLQLTLRKIKHICRRVEKNPGELGKIISNTLMMSFLPDWERGIVEKCLSKANISLEINEENACNNIREHKLIDSCKRSPSNTLLVPRIRFEENPGQARVMGDILEAHSVGERALLISGYQGVGKNRIVDYLLSILHCEREYQQLHRDTTIQSLMLIPSIENGKVIYHDSPLTRAAKHGRILVLDEADKAPVDVVAVLKGLIEDGQLALPDGKVLCYGESSDPNIISIHPDFSIWTLANPAGWPFHGNDLAREMADVFSCHNVPPMDKESHKRILSSYGRHVKPQLIQKIVEVWDDLRVAHEIGTMTYPFSIRESVNVVKHLNAFPNDNIDNAIENVIAFDRLDTSLTKHLDGIFSSHGIQLQLERNGYSTAADKTFGEGGRISTPKTRSSIPKVGKDPDGKPHVGGNTWAGGTGGSDTAGLGGRGGPYRIDAGHPVHQISDEMKAEVSEEAQRMARSMAKKALKEKLKELDMGKHDWNRYNQLRAHVNEQISQLKSLLRDLKKRNEERVWLKNQSTGELDDSRIVDALSGERDVFKRRGNPDDSTTLHAESVTIKLVVDISASMYRFNSFDNRLQRLLEATLMMMETFRDDRRFKLHIIGHSGSSANIQLVNPETSLDEATQLKVLDCMAANTQYTYAGDNTIEAIHRVVSESKKNDLVIIISDANLERYHITVDDLSPLQNRAVHTHLIFIGSLGNEAMELAQEIPNERATVCFQSSDLPLILKKIVSNSLKQ